MKIIAYYLPQFHEIEENNYWWGKGYTDWIALKNAKKLFHKHRQPRIPLDNYYYDLTNINTLEWQAYLARSYGIYGFCIYHYWFEGKLLLNKPLELLLNNNQIKIHYCICWANEDWTNGWVSSNPEILIKQTYGTKDDWKSHFFYMLPYLKDERYIRIDGRPLVVIYHPENIPCLNAMLNYWNELALEHHLPKIAFASQHPNALLSLSTDFLSNIDYQIEYQPDIAGNKIEPWYYYFFKYFDMVLDHIFRSNYFSLIKFLRPLVKKNYIKTWEYIIHMSPNNTKRIPGAFVDWDNTPRKGKRGSLYTGVTPELFYKYMKTQIIHTKNVYKKEYLFLFAWNEWSEGGYLEPDTENRYDYLNAVKKALEETQEWEKE